MRAPRRNVEASLEVVLTGRFRLYGPSGEDLTPRAAKAQACLALLSTSSQMERSRAWICDKLWSDRGQEQARGSLRQTLSAIRQSLGRYEDILVCDRTSIALDSSRVRVTRSRGEELLEGIDILDPEWNDWLRQERSSLVSNETEVATLSHVPLQESETEIPSHREGFRISFDTCGGDTSEERFLSEAMAEKIARNLAESTGLSVRNPSAPSETMKLRVRAVSSPRDRAMSLSLQHAPNQEFVWSQQCVLSDAGNSVLNDPVFHQLVFEAQSAIVEDYLKAHSDRLEKHGPLTASQFAARRVLTFDLEQIDSAVETLVDVCSSEEFAPAFGWLLFALRAKYYEDSTAIVASDVDRIEDLCRKALEIGSTNSFVLSAVSAIYLRILDLPEEGVELARQAARLNASNPFAIDALASAMYLGDRAEQGYLLSCTAANLAQNTRFFPFFGMSRCVGATLTGRTDEAKSMAVMVSTMSPKLRSAWRFRLALSAHAGKMKEALRCKSKLEQHDPGFNLDRMFADPSYPVHTLRNSNVNLGQLKLL